MKYRIIVCIAGVLCATGIFAEQAWQFSYKGYPHKTTSCYEPAYFAGEEVTLSLGVPVKEGRTFLGWRYKAEEQLLAPGATFIMPAEDVIITGSSIPTAIDNSQCTMHNSQCTKVLRDGQLFILRGNKVYTVTGQELR